MVRRAEVAQAGVRLAGNLLNKRSAQPRLADPRLAGQQDNLAASAVRPLPAPKQQTDLLLASDEWGQSRPMECLEPALDGARSKNLVGVDRCGKAFDLDASNVAVLEQITQKLTRLRADHDGVGFCQDLQPGGQVGRLANDAPLLSLTVSNQIADDH